MVNEVMLHIFCWTYLL